MSSAIDRPVRDDSALPRSLSIGRLTVDSPFVLAPMAGITDRQFRRVLRRIGGVGILTMEFVSSEGLARGDGNAWKILRFTDEERPISIQVYGRDPRKMADAARIVEQSGAELCDVNMGCPANKILKGCAGAALMGDLDLARRVVRDVRSAISIPLTVKFRAGLREDAKNDLELGRICEAEGADAVALHPRTAKQMYRGRADWSRIARLKRHLSIPVLGNGDVATADDAIRMLRETGADGVLIGRASMTNPWIYRQASARLDGRPAVRPTLEQFRRVILDHFTLVMEEEDRRTVLHKLRTFTGWYSRGLPGGRDLRVQISALSTPEAFLDAIERWFASRDRAA